MALPVIPENIPEELRVVDRWVVWKEREEKNKDGEIRVRKEPRTARGGLLRWKDERNLLKFGDAYNLYKTSKIGFDGIGFVLEEGSGIVGIDIDDKFDSGLIGANTYTELSPSGRGYRAFGYADRINVSLHPKGLGIFTGKRFLTVTGHIVSGVLHLANLTRSLQNIMESIEVERFIKKEGAGLNKEKLNELLRENSRFGRIWKFEAMDDYESFSEADMGLIWHPIKAGWTDGEIADLLVAFRQRGREKGYDTKGKEERINDYISGTIRETRDRVDAETEKIPYLSLQDALKLPPIQWSLDGIIPMHSVGMLWGAPSSAKTFIAFDLMLRAVCGIPWHGDRGLQDGDVLYILSEGVGDLSNRLKAWFRFHEDAKPKHEIAIWTHAPQFVNGGDMADIRMFCKRRLGNLRFIVFDTLARSLVGQEENSNMVMGRVADALTILMKETQASILVLHHGTKPGESMPSVARGGGALVGALDYSIESKRVYTSKDAFRQSPLKNIFEVAPDKPPRGGAAFQSFPILLQQSGDGVVVNTDEVLTDWMQNKRKLTYSLSADQFVALLKYHKMSLGSAEISERMRRAGLDMERDAVERTLREIFPVKRATGGGNGR